MNNLFSVTQMRSISFFVVCTTTFERHALLIQFRKNLTYKQQVLKGRRKSKRSVDP